jgi:aminotransferase
LPKSSRLNQTLLALPPSGIRKFFDIVAQMKNVISLGVGEPDFCAPWRVRETCIFALERGETHYTSNLGRPDLRHSVSAWLQKKYGLKYSEDEILVTNAVSEGFDLAVRALLNPGDEVLSPSPAYVMYEPLIRLAGGTVRFYTASAQADFNFTAQAVTQALTPKTKVLILGYPNNPTGKTFSRSELVKIARLAEKHDLFVISDEIYSELAYEAPHTSFASLPKMKARTITLNGFSKAFAMTGLRLGYLCAPLEILKEILKIHQYAALCASSIAQLGGIEALENCADEVAEMKEEYDLRRKLVISECRRIGLPCPHPDGAFYIFPSVKKTGLSGEEFAVRLLQEEKVAVVPGTAFGVQYGDRIRISYATKTEDLREAFLRIGKFVEKF